MTQADTEFTYCPYCGGENLFPVPDPAEIDWECRECLRTFTVTLQAYRAVPATNARRAPVITDLGPLMLGTVGFGTRLDETAVRAVVDAALDAGVTGIDTADVYGLGASETVLGRVLKGRRDQVIVATKFGITMNGANGDETARSSPDYIGRAVRASLRRLGTDHIDLYQWHSPDRRTPFAETLGALDDLVSQGLVRAVGVSNLTGAEVESVVRTAHQCQLSPPVTAQNEYSLYNRSAERDLLPACERLGVGVLAYFPLASGLLTRRYRPGEPAPAGSRLDTSPLRLAGADWDVIGRIDRAAAKLGVTTPRLALSWLAARSAVAAVVAGASSPQQVRANVEAVTRPLPPELLAELWHLPHTDAGHTTFATRAR